MSLLRRWFDPIRSRWFYQKPIRQTVVSTEQGLSIHLRLDDVYSYLAVQQLPQIEEILVIQNTHDVLKDELLDVKAKLLYVT